MRVLPFVVVLAAANPVPAQQTDPEKEGPEAVALRLGDPDVTVRRAAVGRLLELRPDLADLRAKLESITAEVEEQGMRNTAIGLGGGVGRLLANVPRIAVGLDDADPAVRGRTVEQLCSFGDAAADYQGDILALLDDPDADVRAAVAKGVARLGWNEESRAGILRALKDASAVVRKAAAEALGEDRNDAGVVAALRGAVQDPDLDVRATVVRSLGKSGVAGLEAASDIVAMLRDREEKVRVAALDAVRFLELRDERAVEEVVRCLDDTDRKVLVAALRGVVTMGEAAAGGTDRVLELTRHERDEVRTQALSAAWEVAPAARRGAVILRTVEMLADVHEKVAGRAEGYLLLLVRDSRR